VEYRLSLTLRSTLAEIERLSKEFGRFAEQHGLAQDVRFCMNLALEEIVTNVIEHGWKDRNDQFITVEVVIGPCELTARVEDDSPPFDPLQLPPPDVTALLEQRRPGGMGIHLAKKMLDGLHYSCVDGRNRLELRKRLARSERQETKDDAHFRDSQ
jgi:anti-sigma regulatory factor (Ser/Thr protein kinase)